MLLEERVANFLIKVGMLCCRNRVTDEVESIRNEGSIEVQDLEEGGGGSEVQEDGSVFFFADDNNVETPDGHSYRGQMGVISRRSHEEKNENVAKSVQKRKKKKMFHGSSKRQKTGGLKKKKKKAKRRW
jgi:hypothetical protein